MWKSPPWKSVKLAASNANSGAIIITDQPLYAKYINNPKEIMIPNTPIIFFPPQIPTQ
ncbi:hypothetical protein SDC9_212870 [bioreactor metagenome]|uniref:Uncharacterized protein n=1 Tax=bioreactor metagenome TaxID=1076179 RepID=A0A645JN84_9ZZZZ